MSKVRILYTHEYSGGEGDSHRLLTLAIAKVTNLSEDEISIARNSAGKPYLVQDGMNTHWSFSISHSGTTWAALFANSECGLDIEYPRICDDIGIAKRFYQPDDAWLVEECVDEKIRQELFFCIWTRREALVKAISASVTNPKLPAVGRSLSLTYEKRKFQLLDISLPGREGVVGAICVESYLEDIEAILPDSVKIEYELL